MTGTSSTGYAIPDEVDPVSPAAGAALVAATIASPDSHEIPARPVTTWNQGSTPACVACATTAAVESARNEGIGLSAPFIYYVTAVEFGGRDEDGTLDLFTALRAACERGIARGDLFTTVLADWNATGPPSPAAYRDASTRALGGRDPDWPFRAIDSTSRARGIREQLLMDRPVLIGFRMPMGYPESFLDGDFAWRDADRAPSGTGHCVLLTGFNDLMRAFRVWDSQGDEHSFEKGQWWMGYRIVDSSWTTEAFTITL